MKTYHPLTLGSLFCVGALLLTVPAQAFVGGRGARAGGTTYRTGTYQSQHFGSGTFNSTVNRQPGSATGTATWANQYGGTGTHTFNNTYSSTGVGSGTGAHQSSTTYANGKTSSSQGSWVRSAPGDSTYTGTHTEVSGDVVDVSRNATTSNGVRTVDSTYDNTATGKTSTVDKTISSSPSGSKQVDTTATGPNGKAVTSDQTYTKTSDGYDKSGTITGPKGNTATDNNNVTFTNNANGTVTRTASGSVTGPNGKTATTGNTETWTKTYTPNSTPTPTSTPSGPD